MIQQFLLVGLGGAAGSMLRYGCNIAIAAKNFPLSTVIVNIVGSFVIGLILALSIKSEGFSQNWKLLLSTGVCGGFTTFSAFSADSLVLLQQGKYNAAAIYILISVLLSIAAVWLGLKIINS
jgi:fluoride exporter